MVTKIAKTIKEWVPEVADFVLDRHKLNEHISDYILLQELATICACKINSGSEKDLERVQEIAKIVNVLYHGENQYVRNAIENEFLTNLSSGVCTESIKKYLGLFPIQLKEGYIKTILNS